MTVRNGGFPRDYYRNNFEAPGAYGGPDSPTASEDSNSSKRKCIGLSYAKGETFGVPMKVFPLSDMSSLQRKDLIHRFRQELDQIRSFRKKVEFPRANSVIVPSMSDLSRAKGSAKLRCSTGPGKVNPLNAAKPAPVTTAMMLLMKQCEALLKRMMSHQYAWVFNTPVDVVKLNIPDYFTIIKHPMDLGTVKSKLTSGTYSSPLEFAADVRLTFSNAMTYNPPGNDVHIMADTLSKFFEVRWKTIEKKLPGTETHTVPANSSVHDDKEITVPVPMAKKRRMDAVNGSVVEPTKKVMTADDRHKLGRDLESLGDFPMHIVNFLREHCSNGGQVGDEEIEIDINDLSDDALFSLRKILDEHLQESQKKDSEPCEIEVLHGSGPGNSSMQHCDGSELADEEVDIGENEPPVSSASPVRIEKDVGLGNANDSGSISPVSTSDDPKITSPPERSKGPETMDSEPPLDEKTSVLDRTQSSSGLDQPQDASQDKLGYAEEADYRQDGNSDANGRQLPPEKRYRAAVLKNRYADLILKAREKTLGQNDKQDPDKLRREREELELQKKKEKARLQAEAKAAEEARRRAEAQAAAEAAAEAKRKLELEREAARQALLEMEQSVEINENSKFLKDLEMLKTGNAGDSPNVVEGGIPDLSHDVLGSFSFAGTGNPLEQLGLFMKHDDEEDEPEPPTLPNPDKDIEEGEID